jgi:hypothetical protein
VRRLRLRRRRHAELVPEPHPQLVVDDDRLRPIPRPVEKLHEEPRAALAQGSHLHEPPRRPLRGRELGPADPQRSEAAELEGADEHRALRAAAILGPERVLTGQERTLADVLRDPGRAPAASQSSRANALSARCSASRAAWTSTQAPSGSCSRIDCRPSSSAIRRSFDSSALRAESAPSGGRSPQRRSRSSVRVTGRRSWTTNANSRRPWRPGSRSSTRVPASRTTVGPHRTCAWDRSYRGWVARWR